MDLNQLWINTVQELSKEVKRTDLITWYKNTAALSVKKGTLTIGLPLPMFLKWHQERFNAKTFKAAQAVNSDIKKIAYTVDIKLGENDARAIDLLNYFPEKATRKLPKKEEIKVAGTFISKKFNPRYNLDNFIIAPETRLAHAACKTVAKYPGENYNPLFIYGGVGLGKTHLLQATGREILQHDPSKIVVYVTCEQFVNELIAGIQSHQMEQFRNKYRKADALIIDDIQFIANKDRTQEEFFHTFNTLYDASKQIIISSDRPPHQLTLLSDRLVSRFGSGMTVDVKMPDYETRLAILQRRSLEAQVFINQKILEFMAEECVGSVRELEGALKQVIAQYELEATSPTLDSVKGVLHRVKSNVTVIATRSVAKNQTHAVGLSELIDFVAEYYAVPKEDILGESRMHEFIIPRQIIMYLAKTKLRLSLASIGKSVGNRNHTTVMHAVGKVQTKLKSDRQLMRDINAIAKETGIF